MKLTLEPIPISSWGKSLANLLPTPEWLDLRQEVLRKAGYKCEVCNCKTRDLHCHEVWKFDDRKKVQTLADLLCICTYCHDVKHFGRSLKVYPKSHIKVLKKHWCEVNNLTMKDFEEYTRQIFEMNKRRADNYYVVKVGRRILS